MVTAAKHRRTNSSIGSFAEAGRVARALVVLVGIAALVVILRFAVYDYLHGGRTLAALQEMIRF